MAAEYTYLVENILTQKVFAELPLADVVYDDFLRRPGSLRATLPVADPKATQENLDAARVAIYVQRDGVIEWGGRLLTPTVPLGSETISIVCEGWLGYWDHRDIWTDRQFTDTDQFEIFQTLVDDAQDPTAIIDTTTLATNGTGADVGITVGWDALSGVLRTREEEYRYFAGKNLGDALRQLGALIDGFDYAMEYTITGDQIVKTIRLFYPQKGTNRGHLFEYARGAKTNVLERGKTVDASAMAWRDRGWGAGADVSRLMSQQITEARRGIYPFLDGKPSFSSVVEQATLDDNTRAAVASTDHPIVLPSIKVDPDKEPKWGTYGTGDTVHVRIDDGWASLDAAHRILGYTMDADNDRPTLVLEAA